MRAREIMTPNPLSVTPDVSVARAAEIMREHDVGCLPVIVDGDIPVLIGLLTDRDITVRCVARHQLPLEPVRAFMTPTPLHTVGPDDEITAVIGMMERSQVRRIPVVSHDGVLLGMIAQADLARRIGPQDPRVIEVLLERISAPSLLAV